MLKSFPTYFSCGLGGLKAKIATYYYWTDLNVINMFISNIYSL